MGTRDAEYKRHRPVKVAKSGFTHLVKSMATFWHDMRLLSG
jgi:hypothetical protein